MTISQQTRRHIHFRQFSFAFALTSLGLGPVFFARPASAQCGLGNLDYRNVSLEPGVPFQGEFSTTFTFNGRSWPGLANPPAGSVARDSQGRVRIEQFGGKYKIKAADGTETQADRILVSICDSVARNTIQLDTVNKTATVQASRTVAFPLKPGSEPQQSYCTRLFSRPGMYEQTEDLGHQLISGFDTVGQRLNSFRPDAPDTGSPSHSMDRWCSDDLHAVILQTSVLGPNSKSETLLQNIVRREPDAALFQIPSDYTILQREDNRLPSSRP